MHSNITKTVFITEICKIIRFAVLKQIDPLYYLIISVWQLEAVKGVINVSAPRWVHTTDTDVAQIFSTGNVLYILLI